MNKKIKTIILFIILILISYIFIIFNAQIYKINVKIPDSVNINDLNIDLGQNKEFIKIINQKNNKK